MWSFVKGLSRVFRIVLVAASNMMGLISLSWVNRVAVIVELLRNILQRVDIHLLDALSTIDITTVDLDHTRISRITSSCILIKSAIIINTNGLTRDALLWQKPCSVKKLVASRDASMP